MVLPARPSIAQTDPPRSPRDTLPTMYDLPSEDPQEPGLPDEFHDLQPQLLSRTLKLAHYDRSHCFTASDLNLYYDVNHPLWHKRPDWFLVVDVPRLYEGRELRRSYVVWQEGHSPEVVVEFLSPGTEAEDLGRFYDATQVPADQIPDAVTSEAADDAATQEPPAETSDSPPGKFEVYERHLRVPHYLVYSRYTQRLRYFKLEGSLYGEQPINSQNPLVWLTGLEIGLGIWQGEFEGVPGRWLRWCNRSGEWLLTDTEQAQLAEAQVQAQLLQSARNLLFTGMSMEQVVALLSLSETQAQLLQSFEQR